MNGIEKILVAVDSSAASDAALEEAITLAKATGAHLVVAHVTSLAGERSVPDDAQPHRMPDIVTSGLARAVARVETAGVPATSELLIGWTPRQLALTANDVGADLIVVGSRHLNGVKRAMLGSTSRALLDASDRPVLVVPAPAEEAA